MAKTAKTEQTKKVRFYKKASFPWAIIVIITALAIGLVSGWMLRSHDQNRVEHQAQILVQHLKQND